jgi:hypothetical protein
MGLRKKLFRRTTGMGKTERLERLWTLRRSGRTVHCDVYPNPAGWELRLTGNHLYPRTKVCATAEDVQTTQKLWKAMLERDGWGAGRGHL